MKLLLYYARTEVLKWTTIIKKSVLSVQVWGAQHSL
jgi:hypothetical protein